MDFTERSTRVYRTKMLYTKEELAAMGERGHRFILENYEYDVLAKKFIDVFESPYKAKK